MLPPLKVNLKLKKTQKITHLPDHAARIFKGNDDIHSFLVHDNGKEDHERTLVFGDEILETKQLSSSWLAYWRNILSPKIFHHNTQAES